MVHQKHTCIFDYTIQRSDFLQCQEGHWEVLLPDRRERVLAELLALGYLQGNARREAERDKLTFLDS